MRYLFEACALDADRRELRRGDRLVEVEPQVFDLLVHLIRHRDRVVSKDDLLASVWHGRVVSESALFNRINAARTAIGDTGAQQRLIRTLPRKGLRFVGEVHESQIPISPPATFLEPAAEHQSAIIGATDDGGPFDPAIAPDKPSIAVLPFANMSGDAEQGYFADGIAEELTTAIARFSSLFVIARNSAFTYKGRAVEARQVGRELGVRYLLEGSVRKAGGRVRITGQLIYAENGAHVWAERYEGSLDDVFALQDRIVEEIVGALAPNIERSEIERARRKHPDSLDAYDLYLRALPDYYAMTQARNKSAEMLARRSLALNPNFVPAIMLLGGALIWQAVQGWSPSDQVVPEGMRLAWQGLEIDKDDAPLLAATARALAYIEGRHDEAASMVARAIALNPNLAVAWAHSGRVHIAAGRPEIGLEHLRRALRLDPKDPMAHDTWTGMSRALILLRRDEEAIAAARIALQMRPTWVYGLIGLAAALALSGRLPEARTTVERILEIEPNLTLARAMERGQMYSKPDARLVDGLRMAGLPE